MKKNVGSKYNNNPIYPSNSSKKKIIKGTMPSNLAPLNSIKINNSSLSIKIPSNNNDENFISIINQLSRMINGLYASNNSNFSQMKNLLVNNSNISENNNLKTKNEKEGNISSISNSFNQIETSFNDFYSNAKLLFQKMKLYENNIISSSSNSPNKKRNNPFKSVDNAYNKNIEINNTGSDIDNYSSNNINQRINKNLPNNICYSTTNDCNVIKINNQMKKNNKLTNKSSSSAINTSSYYSVDKNSYKSLTKHRNTKNHNKHVIVVNQNNNLAVLSGKKVENNLNDNDVESKFNSILEENEELKNRNIILEK